MVDIKYYPKEFKITFSGHAGGTKGKDLVCAAVSTLFYTLAEALTSVSHMLVECPLVKDAEEDDEKIICCTPHTKYARAVDRMFWTVTRGLRMLACEHPSKVRFTVIL